MHLSVKDNFMTFTKEFEGGPTIDYMFIDSAGRIGTAYGVDLDFNGNGPPRSLDLSRSQGLPRAKQLSWVLRSTGQPADENAVAAEWETIKALPLPPKKFTWYKQYAKLKLTDASIKKRVLQMAADNETTLKKSTAFSNFERWPADAQLVVLGLSWNGVGNLLGDSQATLLHPQQFRAACQAEDFNRAAEYCRMSEVDTNDSIYRRWMAQRTCLWNAAIVLQEEFLGNYNRATLYWPRMLDPRLVTSPPHPNLIR